MRITTVAEMGEGLTWGAAGGDARPAGMDIDHSVFQRRLLGVWEKALPGLARLVAGMGCGPGCGEDVLQDVYLSALRSRAGRLAPAGLRRWLFRVAINRCREEHRRRARFRRAVANFLRRRSDPPVAASAAAEAARRQDRRAVAEALAMLEEHLKAPLVMRYLCEMECRQIAEILGLPDSTVRSRLRAGRGVLAEALKKAGFDGE